MVSGLDNPYDHSLRIKILPWHAADQYAQNLPFTPGLLLLIVPVLDSQEHEVYAAGLSTEMTFLITHLRNSPLVRELPSGKYLMNYRCRPETVIL